MKEERRLRLTSLLDDCRQPDIIRAFQMAQSDYTPTVMPTRDECGRPVRSGRCFWTTLTLALLGWHSAHAQAAPPMTVSWLSFGNYQAHTDSAARANNGGKATNRFDLERLYLNFKVTPYPRDSVVVTTDLFQQTDTTKAGYYRGWAVRIKYAYLHFNLVHDSAGLDAALRLGMVHTVIVPHAETFWPRYLGPTANERYGFAVGADVGAAAIVTMPWHLGEIFATLTNGNGFTAPETDRFKDAAVRVSFTPLARLSVAESTFTISWWLSRGLVGSKFLNGGPGQVGPVTEGLDRDRWGALIGVREHRLNAGVEYARRTDGVEQGANTPASPWSAFDRRGDAIEAFALIRPFELRPKAARTPFGLIVRTDRFRSDVLRDGAVRYMVTGAFWEPHNNNNLTFSVDYQRQWSEGVETTPEQKITYFHWQVRY